MSETVKHDRPVFIHAMWRTGSTYIWNKFREAAGFRAYCEPLHEQLWRLRRRDFDAEQIQATNQILRHPLLKKHYFDELPFDAEGRVPGFREEFTFDTYCLDADESNPDLAAYIQGLLDFAEQHQEIPVLQFNRSLFRSAWLSAHFAPLNLLLLRNPFDTWKSLLMNEYFPGGVCRIVGQHRNRSCLRAIAERWKVPYVEGTYDECEAAYRAFFNQHGDGLYPMYFALSMVSVLYNLPHTDIVLDINAISGSEAARHEVEAQLREHGIDVSFEDCSIPRYSSGESEMAARQEQEQNILDFLRGAYQSRRRELQPQYRRHAAVLSPDLQSALDRILGD